MATELDEPLTREMPALQGQPLGGPGSVLHDLRQRRAAVAQSKRRELLREVPEYDGRLLVRYIYPEVGYQPVAAAIERAQTSKDRDAALWSNCDLLAICCDTLLGRNDKGALVNLQTEEVLDGDALVVPPLRFGRLAAELFGIEIPAEVASPSRFTIRAIFSPRAEATGIYDGDLALMRTGGEVLDWLSAEERDISEAYSGE